MNALSIISLASSLIQATQNPAIQKLLMGGLKNLTPANIAATLPTLEGPLAELGALISPAAESGVHAIIGFTSAALSNTPMGEKVQVGLNAYLKNTPGFIPLVVDGKLGPKTNDAIRLAQAKANIKVDGWFGIATATAIGLVF